MVDDEVSLGLFSPLTVGEDFWEAARHDVDAIIDHTGIEPGSRVLLLPRGAGQYALAFAEREMEVVAVGPEGDAYALATERAEELGLEVDFRVGEPEDFQPDGSFDLVVNLSSSLEFVKPDDTDDVLSRIQGALAKGGWLVLRMVAMDKDQRRVTPRDWSEKEGLLILEELEYDWDIGWVNYRWLIVAPDGRRYEFHLGHQGYDAQVLLDRVKSSGFQTIEHFGSLDAEEYASDTPLIIFACK